MASRCFIGIKRTDGSVEFISCHYDGYIEATGRTLLEHYQEKEKIESLIKLGNISILRENIEAKNGEDHSFEEPAEDVTIAYHRDRNEELHIYKADSVAEFQKMIDKSWMEYVYLYDEKKSQWYVNDMMDYKLDQMKNLDDAVEEEMMIIENANLKMN